jgi:hypothetical protein
MKVTIPMKSDGSPILLTFYAIISLLVLVTALFEPSYNWDIIPYIASAKALETDDTIAIHSFAYSEVEKSNAIQVLSLSIPHQDSVYRSLMRNDCISFSHTLLFYRIRVVYIGLIYLLYKIGMNIVFATHFISAVAIFCTIWALYFICRKRVLKPFQYAIIPIALAFGMDEAAKLSTPDALLLLVVLIAVYYFLESNIFILIALPVLVAIRTDMIILAILFSVILLWLGITKKTLVFISLAFSIGIYLFLNWYYQYPGWKAVFCFSLIDNMTYADYPLSLSKYLRTLIFGLWTTLSNAQFLFFYTITGFAWYIVLHKSNNIKNILKSRIVGLLIMSNLYVCIRMILFPAPYLRFFISPFIMTTISLFVLLSSWAVKLDNSIP